jgi:hypothetical protein
MISFNIILPSAVRFPELFCTGGRSGGESDANVGEELRCLVQFVMSG